MRIEYLSAFRILIRIKNARTAEPSLHWLRIKRTSWLAWARNWNPIANTSTDRFFRICISLEKPSSWPSACWQLSQSTRPALELKQQKILNQIKIRVRLRQSCPHSSLQVQVQPALVTSIECVRSSLPAHAWSQSADHQLQPRLPTAVRSINTSTSPGRIWPRMVTLSRSRTCGLSSTPILRTSSVLLRLERHRAEKCLIEASGAFSWCGMAADGGSSPLTGKENDQVNPCPGVIATNYLYAEKWPGVRPAICDSKWHCFGTAFFDWESQIAGLTPLFNSDRRNLIAVAASDCGRKASAQGAKPFVPIFESKALRESWLVNRE